MSGLDIIRELNRVKVEFQLRSIATVMGFAAQGGEARQGGDACGSVHEHPVAEGHAPNSCPSHPINTQGEDL